MKSALRQLAICYGRKGIYPTIHFERCREGAEDFYLYSTLAKRISALEQAGRGTGELAAAKRVLAGLTADVELNQRQPPARYDADQLKALVVDALETLR